MTLEYVLLLALFVLFLFRATFLGPAESFVNAGPKLGARVEKHLITGDRFSNDQGSYSTQWKEFRR
jgi:hypothetical protein